MEARKNNFTCYIPHNFGHHKSLQVWKPLPLVSVICGPLSGWVVDVTVLYLVVGLFLCFAFGYSKELGFVGKTHTLIFSQVPMILCSCIGYSTGMESPCLSKSSRWRPTAIHTLSSPTFGKSSAKPEVLPVSWRQEWAPWTWFIIQGKNFSCTSLWGKRSLQLLGQGFGQPNFTWNPMLRWAVDFWASKAIGKHLKIGFGGKGAYWPYACRFPLLKVWGCFWCLFYSTTKIGRKHPG